MDVHGALYTTWAMRRVPTRPDPHRRAGGMLDAAVTGRAAAHSGSRFRSSPTPRSRTGSAPWYRHRTPTLWKEVLADGRRREPTPTTRPAPPPAGCRSAQQVADHLHAHGRRPTGSPSPARPDRRQLVLRRGHSPPPGLLLAPVQGAAVTTVPRLRAAAVVLVRPEWQWKGGASRRSRSFGCPHRPAGRGRPSRRDPRRRRHGPTSRSTSRGSTCAGAAAQADNVRADARRRRRSPASGSPCSPCSTGPAASTPPPPPSTPPGWWTPG